MPYLRLRRMASIRAIRQKVVDRAYYLSSHPEDEMWDDGFERMDIENAILKGRIEKRMTRDPRGTRYRIEGPALDGRVMHLVCRLAEDANLVIVTLYALGDEP